MLTLLPDMRNLVSELLLGVRLGDVQYCRIRVARPFGLSFGKAPGRTQFHFVGHGPMPLRDTSGATARLGAGDTVLLPRGTPHALLFDPGTPCREIAGFKSAKICDTMASVDVEAGAAPGNTLIFNVCMELDLGDIQPLVGTMPEFMHVGTLLTRYPEVHPIFNAIEHKSRSKRAGFAGVLAQLADMVAAFIVRGWVECGCDNATGWMQTLRKSKLGPAIIALHRDPERNWSITELAA